MAASSSSADRDSTKLPTIWPPAKPISIRTRSSATHTHHLGEDPVHGVGMDKGNLEAEHASPRRVVDQLCPFLGEVRERRADVVDLVRDVMHPRASLVEEPADRSVLVERSQ